MPIFARFLTVTREDRHHHGHGQQGARPPGAARHREGTDRPEAKPPVQLCRLYRDHELRHGTAGQVGQFDFSFRNSFNDPAIIDLRPVPGVFSGVRYRPWWFGYRYDPEYIAVISDPDFPRFAQ